MEPTSLTVAAYAKINWSLWVLGKRPDGYHNVETVLQTISLHDTIHFESIEADQIRFWCDYRSIPADESNLVWRAAATLRERYSIDRGVKVRLEKRIPSEAGLGGGSSDAAATLIALSRLWKIETSGDELLEIASGLGSDVPFFLHGGTARGTGRGNMIEALEDAAEQHLVIIKPNANVSTAKAYQALNAHTLTTSDAKPILFRSQRGGFSDFSDLNALHNDFGLTVFQLEPEIERAKNALLESGARGVMLAGSGSAVHGIFENKNAQERAIQAIELETGWRAFPCKTVGRSQFRQGLGDLRGLP